MIQTCTVRVFLITGTRRSLEYSCLHHTVSNANNYQALSTLRQRNMKKPRKVTIGKTREGKSYVAVFKVFKMFSADTKTQSLKAISKSSVFV